MKGKKVAMYLLTLCVVFSAVGCGKTTAHQDAASGKVDLSNMQEEKLDLDRYSLEVKETDPQIGLRWNRIAKAESGYYMWEDDMIGLLTFFDVQTKQFVPLCNRPDCTHESAECNAFFNAYHEGDIEFERYYLQYYEGKLYIIGCDEDGYLNLYRVAADGSSCEKYMQLFKIMEEEVQDITFPRIYIYRGYVYYSDLRESEPKIYRMKLGSDKKELVYEPAERTDVGNMEGYGDYLFFRVIQSSGETSEEFSFGLFAYNVQTQKLYLVGKDRFNYSVIIGDTILYREDSGIRAFSMSTQKDELIIADIDADANVNLGADEEYIYIYNSKQGELKAYSYDGDLICEVLNENLGSCYFGDGTYLFAQGYRESDDPLFAGQIGCPAILEISDLADGEAQWEYLVR